MSAVDPQRTSKCAFSNRGNEWIDTLRLALITKKKHAVLTDPSWLNPKHLWWTLCRLAPTSKVPFFVGLPRRVITLLHAVS